MSSKSAVLFRGGLAHAGAGGGLLVFGFVFAVSSSVHSFLILTFTGAVRGAMDVGFHYVSNAAGQLVGALLSAIGYQLGGLRCISRPPP